VKQEDYLAAVEALERQLLDPRIRSSRERLDQLIAADFIEFGSSGRAWSKNEIIEALLQSPGREIGVESIESRCLCDDVVLVTYRSWRVGEADPAAALRSSIWRRQGDTWQLVFHQGTKAQL